MRYKIDMDHPLTVEASRRMHAVQPLKLLGWIFGGIGLLFLILGVIFVLIGWEYLPQVFTAQVWTGDPPDSLALPLVGLVFSGIGVLFTALGAGFLIALRRQRLLREELERYGTRVSGTVTGIVTDRSYQVNGRHPLRLMVRAEHPFTHEEQTLRSGPVWETSLAPGDAIEVLFDPQDAKKHVILTEQP